MIDEELNSNAAGRRTIQFRMGCRDHPGPQSRDSSSISALKLQNAAGGAATNLPVDKVKQISMAVSSTAQEAALFLLPWGVVWSVGRGLRDIGLVWRRPLKDVLAGLPLGIICLFVSLLSEQAVQQPLVCFGQ